MPDPIGSREVCQRLDIDKATLSRWVRSTPPRIKPLLQLPGKNGAMLFDPAVVDAIAAEIATTRAEPDPVAAAS